MRIEQSQWTRASGWQGRAALEDAQLLLIFGGTDQLVPGRLTELRARYPAAIQFGGSTSGEILAERVYDDTIAVTAIRFDHTRIRLVRQSVEHAEDSRTAGRALAAQLSGEGLNHVLALSTGLNVNGSELVEGIKAGLPGTVQVTGGLAGDGARFRHTLVIADGPPDEWQVAALGLYGDRVQVGFGSLGGWDSFGPDRLITRSLGNVLYELDGQSALALYKQYLGEHAAGLPATGLLFPLALHDEHNTDAGIVRTILSVDEAEQSMTFAGDVPEGMYARLMRANFDRLVEGASGAARAARVGMRTASPELAVLISCVGRKLVLGQRVEEEVEGVRNVLGPETVLAGFYSYGEISPHTPTARCELHNQTMTITTLSET